MLDWAGYGENKVVLDWTLVHDKASAAALSAKIRKIGRIPGRRTSISDALDRSFASDGVSLVNVLTDPADAYPRSSNLA